jgi:hypothetical protein
MTSAFARILSLLVFVAALGCAHAEAPHGSNWPVRCINTPTWREIDVLDQGAISRIERDYYRHPYADPGYRLIFRYLMAKNGSSIQMYVFSLLGIYGKEIGYSMEGRRIIHRYVITQSMTDRGLTGCL